MTKLKFRIIFWSVLVSAWVTSFLTGLSAPQHSGLEYFCGCAFIILGVFVIAFGIGGLVATITNYYYDLPEK